MGQPEARTGHLDPPEAAWPATWLLGYRIAELRVEVWLAIGDVLWRLRLREAAARFAYPLATEAQRDATQIAQRVRDLLAEEGEGDGS